MLKIQQIAAVKRKHAFMKSGTIDSSSLRAIAGMLRVAPFLAHLPTALSILAIVLDCRNIN
jgi:hypothetical protein